MRKFRRRIVKRSMSLRATDNARRSFKLDLLYSLRPFLMHSRYIAALISALVRRTTVWSMEFAL